MPREKKKNNKDGSIPMNIINQLNEYTAGGFVLFYFNSEDGSPEQIMTFDTPAHCLALQKHIADWSTALQDLNIENERNSLISSTKPEKDEDSDEGVL